jgi:hypothetical protein
LARWADGELDRAVASLAGRSAASMLRQEGWSIDLMAAAVVLHLELFVEDAKARVTSRPQLDYAARMLSAYRGRGTDRMLKLRCAVVLGWLLQILGDFEALRAHLQSALVDFPESRALQVSLGVLEETASSPRHSPRRLS